MSYPACVSCKALVQFFSEGDDAPLCEQCNHLYGRKANELARRLLGCGEEQCNHELPATGKGGT